jgi:hypothetical protein
MTTPTADFSQPVYLEESANGAGPQAAALTASTAAGFGATMQSSDSGSVSLADVAVIDLNDPNLLSAELDTNADVDAYAAPPPLPDGRYRIKLKQIDVKGPDGQPARFNVKQGKNGNPPYAYTAIEGCVIDPGGKHDNQKLYDRFVSTMQQRNGGIPIVRILTCLGIQLPAKTNAKLLLDTFFKAVAGEPELEVETVWEGGLDEADRQRFDTAGKKQPRVLGMHRFPQNAKGEAVPDVTLDTELGKVNLHAQVRINGYHPLKK